MSIFSFSNYEWSVNGSVNDVGKREIQVVRTRWADGLPKDFLKIMFDENFQEKEFGEKMSESVKFDANTKTKYAKWIKEFAEIGRRVAELC